MIRRVRREWLEYYKEVGANKYKLQQADDVDAVVDAILDTEGSEVLMSILWLHIEEVVYTRVVTTGAGEARGNVKRKNGVLMNKFFNGRKYLLQKNNRWARTTKPYILLSHDVWNFFHSDDPILKGDGYVIDHIKEDKSDDQIENLRKMTRSEHSRMHASGNQNNLGKYRSDETKQKMSDAHLGKHLSDETKQKIREANLGKHLSDETKQKMRKANLGKNNPNFGKHRLDETKQKISDANMGHIVTEETKQKIREALLGNKNPNWKGGKKK